MKINKTLRKNLIILIVAALAVGVILFLKGDKTSLPSQSRPNATIDTRERTKIFQSKLLKLNIAVPTAFNVKDEGIRLLISNPDGMIILSRNGTQFNLLDDYIKDFDIKHKTQVLNEKMLTINSHPSFSRIIKYPGSTPVGDKIYFIYVGDAVYHISTSSPTLFDDLDQIAQSFRYTP